MIKFTAKAKLPTEFGSFDIFIFTDAAGIEHIAMVNGQPQNGCLVRIHSECATGDIFYSLRCDCGPQLKKAQQLISQSGNGMIVYLRGHEGRGMGLGNKIQAYALQEQGADTVEANLTLGFPADSRDYTSAAEILNYFNLNEITLLTNNPKKMHALENKGIRIPKRQPLIIETSAFNQKYMETKRDKLGHILPDKFNTAKRQCQN